MKRTLYTLIILSIISLCSVDNINAQKQIYTYSKPTWVVSMGPVWNLASNDSYGRANYNAQEQVLRDNYGMRWGWGGYLVGKLSMGKKQKSDRIFLGVDYKGMTNSDFDGGQDYSNETKYNIVTIDAGYEYLFYGTQTFRSYYGAGLTGNFISGEYTPAANSTSLTNIAKSFDSQFRFGMELKAGLEFILTAKKNFGLNVGAKYNLMNLFTDDNAAPTLGQSQNLNLNDGDGTGGPGFKRYIGMLSIDVGISIYPDVKKVIRK